MNVRRMNNLHGVGVGMVALIAMIVAAVDAWNMNDNNWQKRQSLPTSTASSSNNNSMMTRRQLGQVAIAGVVTPLVGTGTVPANAAVVTTQGGKDAAPPLLKDSTTTYDVYNIIPDAGPSLNPKLEKVSVSNFVKMLASSSTATTTKGASSGGGGGGAAIWLGEHHNSKNDHDFQATLIRQLHDELVGGAKRRKQVPMAIGLEQVQIQFQSILDDYIDGKISIEELKNGVEWDTRWMWDFTNYSQIFETAKQLNIKLLALNVNSEDLAYVEKGGYPNLPKSALQKYIQDPIGFGEFAQRKQFSTYVDYVITPSYKIHQQLGLLQTTISGEKLDSPMSFRNFLSGRILWDESMASNAYNWVRNNPGGLLIGLVGADHVKFMNGGIPGRFTRMATSAKSASSTSGSSSISCTTVIINPTLIDSRPSGSVYGVPGSDVSNTPEKITLQLRYLKDNVDPYSEEERMKPESTGGVMPFADYIVVT